MKKLMALVLSVSMVLCAMPASIFAADTTTPATDIKDATIAPIEDQEYTGNAIAIAAEKLVVKVGDTTLKADTDYTVAYEKNTNVGKATVTITGKGAYTGSKTQNFKIVKHFTDADKPVITIPPQKVGEGATLENATVEWDGAPALKEGTHYNFTGIDNSKAGTQTATLKFTDQYFFGEFEVHYHVVDKDISKAALYLNDLSATYTFDGTAKTPAVTIKSGDMTLTEGTDYIVKYEDNINAGTATIRVVGENTYAGDLTKTFTINKAKLADCIVTFNPDAYTSTGVAITPTYTVNLGNYVVKADEYTAAYTNNVNVGEGIATLTAANKNFTGTLTAKFTIAGKAVNDLDCTLATTEFAYDGTAKEPAVTVKEGTNTLVAGTDYTVKYGDNINAGTAKAIISGAGKYAGTKILEFKIKGAASKVITGYTSYVRYLTSKDFNLNARISTGEAGVTFKYTSANPEVATVDEDGYVTIKDTGIAKITVETVGTKTSDPASKVVTVNVKPLKPAFSLSKPAKKQIKVQITKVKGATKYQVRYGRNGKYYSRYVKHIDSKYTKTSTTLKNRTSGKTYYIKVRAIKVMEDGTVVNGNWSATKKIKAK